MASLIQRNGRWVLAFKGATGKRAWLSLGSSMAEDRAGSVKSRIEDLVSARENGTVPLPETMAWASRQKGYIRGVLEKAGLVEKPASVEMVTLASWVKQYGLEYVGAKRSTATNMRMAMQCLIAFFGADKVLEDITAYDAERYRQSMTKPGANRRTKAQKPLSEATIRRRCRHARQIFRGAVKARLIHENPFEDMTCSDVANRARQRTIDRQTIDAVLAACPDAEWRLIVTLARYGGLRCPSEILALQWDDVNWDRQRFIVRASKTEAAESGGVRIVPMYADSPLERLLLDVYSRAAEGQKYVIAVHRYRASKLRMQLLTIIRKAGLEPWTRLWQNLRRTREDELGELGLDGDAIAYFQGHTAAVARKHYRSDTQDRWFDQALRATPAQHEGSRPGTIEADGETASATYCGFKGIQAANASRLE